MSRARRRGSGRQESADAARNDAAWSKRALWGLVAGAALLIGAGIGLRFTLPQWAIALVMAFGVGRADQRRRPTS